MMHVLTNRKMAIEQYSGIVKQLITLSTALIVLPITFSKELLDDTYTSNNIIIFLSWTINLLSIVAGIFALSALVSELEPKNQKGTHIPSIRKKSISTYAMIQIILFLIAVVLTIIFGVISVI